MLVQWSGPMNELIPSDQELLKNFGITWEDIQQHLTEDEVAEALYYFHCVKEALKYCRETKYGNDYDEKCFSLISQARYELGLAKLLLTPAIAARRNIEEQKKQAELLKKVQAEADAYAESCNKALSKIQGQLHISRIKVEKWYRRKSASYPFVGASFLNYPCDGNTLSQIFKNAIEGELHCRIPTFKDLQQFTFEYSWRPYGFLLLTRVDYLTRGKGIPSLNFKFNVEAVFETEIILKEQTVVRDLYRIQCGRGSIGYFYFSRVIEQIERAIPIPVIRGILASEMEPQGTEVVHRTEHKTSYNVEGLGKEIVDILDSFALFIRSLSGETFFAQGLVCRNLADGKTARLIEAKLKFSPRALEASREAEVGGEKTDKETVVGALQALGYSKNVSCDSYEKAKSNFPIGASLEDKIQICLKVID